MMENNSNPGKNESYTSPSVKLIPITAREVLCQSRTERMGYEDLEDGGFH